MVTVVAGGALFHALTVGVALATNCYGNPFAATVHGSNGDDEIRSQAAPSSSRAVTARIT